MLLSIHSHSPVELQSKKGQRQREGKHRKREDVTLNQEGKPNDTKELNLQTPLTELCQLSGCGSDVKKISVGICFSPLERENTHRQTP